VGDVTEDAWTERYDWMARRGDEYYILVVCDGGGKVVGTGCVVVERKFIHNLGLVGHIEDIAVTKDQQGKKLGLRIIEALDYVARKVGCYKVSLLGDLSFGGAVAGEALLWQFHRGFCGSYATSQHIRNSQWVQRSPSMPSHSLLYPSLAPTSPSISYSHHPQSATELRTKLTIHPLTDNPRLLRDKRRLLRQVRLQEGGTGDGPLLRQGLTAKWSHIGETVMQERYDDGLLLSIMNGVIRC